MLMGSAAARSAVISFGVGMDGSFRVTSDIADAESVV